MPDVNKPENKAGFFEKNNSLNYEKKGYQPTVDNLNPVPPVGGSGVPIAISTVVQPNPSKLPSTTPNATPSSGVKNSSNEASNSSQD